MRLKADRSDLPKEQVNSERCEFAHSTMKRRNAKAGSAGIPRYGLRNSANPPGKTSAQICSAKLLGRPWKSICEDQVSPESVPRV